MIFAAMKTNPLLQFIHSERDHYENADNNLFATGLGQAERYYYFLTVALDRYQNAVTELEPLTRLFLQPPEDLATEPGKIEALHERSRELNWLLQMETETFYVFAKILLKRH